MKKLNPIIILLGVLFITYTSCSSSKLNRLFSKTVKIDYEKPQDFRSYSKYQKDAVYITSLLRQNYPRLESKLENYDSVSQIFFEKVSQAENRFEFRVEVQKFLAKLKDGHSSHDIDFKSDEIFNVWFFKEKNRWVLANLENSQDSTLIGAVIKSINGKSIHEVEQLMQSIESGENEYWRLKHPHNIMYPKYCESIELIKENEDMILELEHEGLTQFLTIKKSSPKTSFKLPKKKDIFPFTNRQNGGFFKHFDNENNLAYLQMNTCLDYNAVKLEIDNYTNKLIKPIALKHMKKRLKDAENFGIFLKDFFQQIENESIENLVIDLRYNTGGDERLGKQLIWYLTENKNIKKYNDYQTFNKYYEQTMPKDFKEYRKMYRKKHNKELPTDEINLTAEFYDQPYFYEIEKPNSHFILDKNITKFKGNVYVLIGKYTFSAASILATTMYDNGIGIFVGTPTGNQPSCNTGYSGIKLPYTKELINLSGSYYERPNTTLNDEVALFPHVEISPVFNSYLKGVDLPMQYIMDDISKTTAVK